MKGYDAEDPAAREVLLKKGSYQAPALGLHLTALAVAPPALFITVVGLYTFCYHAAPFLICSIVLLLALAAIALWCLRPRSLGNGPGAAMIFGKVLGPSCLLAVCLGFIVGNYNFHRNVARYWAYVGQREYTNVLPSESALLHLDAGMIDFSPDAYVDRARAIGYHNGHNYCVAPVLNSAAQRTVDFWAVGVDCCKQRGEFTCHDAAKSDIRSGLVVLDAGLRKQFSRASREAAAALGVSTSADALFVEWVADPSQAAISPWRAAQALFCAASVFAVLVSVAGLQITKAGGLKAVLAGQSAR